MPPYVMRRYAMYIEDKIFAKLKLRVDVEQGVY